MAFNISQFKGVMNKAGDLYRGNLFHVNINAPGLGFDQDFQFLCKAAQIPASTVEAIEVPYQNRVAKIAGDRTYEDWTITVLNDQDFKYRHAFELWMQGINQHEGNKSLKPADYKAQMSVTPSKRDDTAIGSYVFEGAFPTAVEAIDLTWESGAQANEYTVTIAYDFWGKTSTAGNIDQ